MAFNITDAKRLIPTLRAHQQHPGGNLMLMAADQLDAAVSDAASTMSLVRSAEAETVKVRKEYEGALLEIKELREKAAVGESAIACVREIAAAKTGAKKIADAWLTKMDLSPRTEPEAPKAS